MPKEVARKFADDREFADDRAVSDMLLTRVARRPLCSPLTHLAQRHLCSLPPLTKTASGLMYRDVPPPPPEDAAVATPGLPVFVHYTGRLEDGTIFDSSHNVGAPIEFTLGKREVIKGWDEGIRDMRVGGKRQLVIPPHLGYGASGAGGVIPPNALLHFDVELISVGQPSLLSRLTTILKAMPFIK